MSEEIELIARLESFPSKLRSTVGSLTAEQLEKKIINWPISTAVHHICDSHLNSYIRIKMALTESVPTIKPYNESEWAKLADISAPINLSLMILEGVHKKICVILHSLSTSDWYKTFYHPELNPPTITILDYVKRFAEHGEHHLQGIKEALDTK